MTVLLKKVKVLVMEDSFLRGTEVLICHPGDLSREVCWLPEARIEDMKKRILGMIKLEECYSLLVY